MILSQQISKHLRELYVGGNWTSVSFKQTLENVTWQEATTQFHSCNTIASLMHHSTYYCRKISNVLKGGALDANDKESFNTPVITSNEEWDRFKQAMFDDAETLASLIENLSEKIYHKTFVSSEYDSYYKNLHGVIEHAHYHLGQIVILKKLICEK